LASALAGAGFRFAFDEDGLLCAGGISMMGSAAQQGAQVSAKKGDSYASNPGLRQKYGRHDGLAAPERKSLGRQAALDVFPKVVIAGRISYQTARLSTNFQRN
jgi:hypothetical protein